MGRSKATPVKFVPGNIQLQNEQVKPKRTPKKSPHKVAYTVFPPTEHNEQYYLGEIVLGTSSNVLPEQWTKCKVRFLSSPEHMNLEMEFDSNISVLVNVTNDFTFTKGLFTSKIFAMRFCIDGCAFTTELFVSELPLPRFNNSIANTIKTAVALVFDEQVKTTEDPDPGKSLVEAKMLDELYRKVKVVRETSLDVPKVCIQSQYLKPKLRPYQEEAVQWMLYREKQPENAEMLHPLYQELLLKTGVTIYFDKYTGHVDITKPVVPSLRTGGILADEMGLGKTVEVIACIFSNPKPNESCEFLTNELIEEVQEASSTITPDTSIEDSSLQTCPTVLKQPKKRKLESNNDCNQNEYVNQPKRLKVPNDWVKASSKKSATYVALSSWYETMLKEVTTKNINKQPSNKVQCICGSTSKKGTVLCAGCDKYQHSKCLGYKKTSGEYKCPQCWMQEPYLESKATLIVCPMSLQKQWCDEICNHVTAGLRMLVYEGSKAAPVYPTELREYDLVLTTYNVLQSELRLSENGQLISLRREPRYCPPGSPLARISWWRLCLDEAQTVEVSSSMISTMAKKLQAHHRWAITGTPIARDVSDLYGLVDYLQLNPYNEIETWNNLLYVPYLSGDQEPMLQFLAQVMWRSSKKDVIDQIDIPKQTIMEYELKFSAVEKFYYKREHELCTKRFLDKLHMFDCSVPVRFLNKSNLKGLLSTLRSICQACTHPSASRGRYLATRKPVHSMEGLLEALIEKNVSDSEENLRVIVSALNGLAGIYLLLQNPVQAVDEYREVMQLSARFNSEDSKKGLNVDKLQLIHTVHNLAEVLEACPPVQPTLRDDTLREHCLELQEKYMERFVTHNLNAYKDSIAAGNVVSTLQEKSTLKPGQWYSALIDWVAVNDLTMDLRTRILNSLENNANSNNKLNFENERKLFYLVATWDQDVTNFRDKTMNLLNKMYSVSADNDFKVTISEGLVQSAMDCHLRPQKKAKNSKKCFVCTVSIAMRQYEAKLFNMTKKNEEDISNTGSWKPTSEELVLKALLSLGKGRNADKEVIANGEIYFNILDAMKKEFKLLRKFWTYLDQQICAHDEISMCKIRLSLKEPNQEQKRQQSKTDNILKKLSTVLENKLEFINLLGAHELEYQASVLKSERRENMAVLERNLGTHSYLETLRKQQFAGQSPDPCPICKNSLQESWSILPCGHCYCLECIQLLLEKTNSNRIACSICRQFQDIENVAYIRLGEEADKDHIKIKGNYSTKIEAIVKLIVKLKYQDDNVKILVFSDWSAALKILQRALENNDIVAELMLSQYIQQSLSKFKNKNKNVNVLLLDIHLGSKGLNLIEATHVILMEPLLNPSDELQAIGRVHRIGQTRPTTVHKFIVQNTIEETIHRAISANADEWDKNKVTLQQFKNLFVGSIENQPIQQIQEEIIVLEEDEAVQLPLDDN